MKTLAIICLGVTIFNNAYAAKLYFFDQDMQAISTPDIHSLIVDRAQDLVFAPNGKVWLLGGTHKPDSFACDYHLCEFYQIHYQIKTYDTVAQGGGRLLTNQIAIADSYHHN